MKLQCVLHIRSGYFPLSTDYKPLSKDLFQTRLSNQEKENS